MSKFGRKLKIPPEGFDYIEGTLDLLDNELREKINEPHEGLRKNESQWPVHQINWQKSRYVYDMYYTYHKISKQVYDYCIENKLVDATLIAKWKKPGYEKLCSTYVINPRNYKFGTVSICRVPKQSLAPGTIVEDPMTGCRGCASGPGGEKNIFGNKYGQYLAAIQIAREERAARKAAIEAEEAEAQEREGLEMLSRKRKFEDNDKGSDDDENEQSGSDDDDDDDDDDDEGNHKKDTLKRYEDMPSSTVEGSIWAAQKSEEEAAYESLPPSAKGDADLSSSNKKARHF